MDTMSYTNEDTRARLPYTIRRKQRRFIILMTSCSVLLFALSLFALWMAAGFYIQVHIAELQEFQYKR